MGFAKMRGCEKAMIKKGFGYTVDPDVGKATQFPYQKNKWNGGRAKTKKFRELLEEMAEMSGEILIPKELTSERIVRGKDKKDHKYIVVEMPSDEAIAANLRIMSARDPEWFKHFCKIAGLYAPVKVAETDTEGNDKMPTNIIVNVIRTRGTNEN